MRWRLLAGFLAGVSSVVGILALLLLLFVIGGFWSLLRDVAAQAYGEVSVWSALGQALAQSLRAVPRYVSSARWGMLACGVLGIVLALADSQRPRIRRPWRDWLGFVVTVGIVTAVVISLQYGGRATASAGRVVQLSVVSQPAALRVSNLTTLVAGVLIACALAALVWLVWRWWYQHWLGWLQIERPIIATSAPMAAATFAEEWREGQTRLARLGRTAPTAEPPGGAAARAGVPSRAWLWAILAGLVATTLLIAGFVHLYDAVGPAALQGELWMTPEHPQRVVSLPFRQAPHRLQVSSAVGSGTVQIVLSAESDTAPLRMIDRLPFAATASRQQTAALSLTGLAPGAYRLTVTLTGGKGGLVRYVAVYGGGRAALLTAGALGLVAGVWVALMLIVLLEVLISQGWLEGAADQTI